MKKIAWLLILLLLVLSVQAVSNKMKLLAVAEKQNGEFIGGVAELTVEIEEGNGRVFIDTYPITKLDTQMSARIAKEIACDFLNKDCSKLDFFYTIRAESALVGGPSAGSAITLLTIATLDGLAVDQDVSVTGTINSGGVIGPVGGLKAKIDAAAKAEIKKVLIPIGERLYEEGNKTIDLVYYGKKKGVEVVEVSNLYDGMLEFIGTKYEKKSGYVVATSEYANLMKSIADKICTISEHLIEKSVGIQLEENETELKESAMEMFNKSIRARKDGNFYSAASFCFGANVQLKYLEILNNKLDEKGYMKLALKIKHLISSLEEKIKNAETDTITNLQTKMIVRERLSDAKDHLKKGLDNINNSEVAAMNFAYSIERFESALFWSDFFDYPGKRLRLDSSALKNSCTTKLAEAEQRVQYIDLFFPGVFREAEKIVDEAKMASKIGDYEFCLFQSSRAKAQSNFYMSIITVSNDSINNYLGQKKIAVERSLLEQIEKGNFPILAYSYYEYGNSLNMTDKYSSLLYYEYSLELSNLDLYLEEQPGEKVDLKEIKHYSKMLLIIFLIAGLIIGFMIGILYYKSNVVAIKIYKPKGKKLVKRKK